MAKAPRQMRGLAFFAGRRQGANCQETQGIATAYRGTAQAPALNQGLIMNHITLTGIVTNAGEFQAGGANGSSLLFHVADSDPEIERSRVWFIVKVKGKAAERVAPDIWQGQIVTVFGRIREPNIRENGAVIIHAKDVVPHILDDEESLNEDAGDING